MQPKWIALIPAYLPTELVLPLQKEARAKDFQLIIVNDGSDQSAESVFQSAAQFSTILHHPPIEEKNRQ